MDENVNEHSRRHEKRLDKALIATRIFETDIIKSIMFELWDTVAEDGQEKADYKPNMDDAWVAIHDDDKIVGLYNFHPLNSVTLQIHAQVRKEYRKEYSFATGQAALKWFLETSYQKLVAEVPVIYPNVRDFCLSQGFSLEGINRKSCRKEGKLIDQWYLGITREELQ